MPRRATIVTGLTLRRELDPTISNRQNPLMSGAIQRPLRPLHGSRRCRGALRYSSSASSCWSDGERAAVFDESLRVLRSALVDESASYYGRYFTVSVAAVAPRPVPSLAFCK